MALIWLLTENFMFKIKGNLSMSYLTFSGVDMHMDAVPCAQRPTPQLCSCATDMTMNMAILYNKNSVCYINKGMVQNNNNVYAGFFQLSNFKFFIDITANSLFFIEK